MERRRCPRGLMIDSPLSQQSRIPVLDPGRITRSNLGTATIVFRADSSHRSRPLAIYSRPSELLASADADASMPILAWFRIIEITDDQVNSKKKKLSKM